MSHINLLNAVQESPHHIRVELAADWKQAVMPNFFIQPGKARVQKVRMGKLFDYARTSGYYIENQMVHFICHHELLAHNQVELGEPVYVAGAFNDWDEAIGQDAWRLTHVRAGKGGYLHLEVPLKQLENDAGMGFKFVSEQGHWFFIPTEARNTYQDGYGNMNYYVDLERSGRHLLDLHLDNPLELNQNYELVLKQRHREMNLPLVPGPFFLEMESDLPLGAMVGDGETCFRLFAPRASEVKLLVADDPKMQKNLEARLLAQRENGVWEFCWPAELTGKFYLYRLDGPRQSGHSHFDPDMDVVDPYALALYRYKGPGIILDKRKYSKPKPFNAPAPNDVVMLETHVRDLLGKSLSSLDEEERLGFAGMTQWLRSEDCYLKKLGVNTIELQPVQENDAKNREEYHWGYMPVNYFSPDSGYGSDPASASQVQEFKDLVDELHHAGMAVVLDVVYNHVGVPAHLLYIDKLYYFEIKPDGELSNWSGCGNDLRCSTPMTRRLIIESLTHLMEFYGVDGFRFDLAELIGLDTLQEVERELRKVNPGVLLIAEPWSFRGHLGADLKRTHYASWNDGYREFMKYYLTGKGDARSLKYFMQGAPEEIGKPWQTVNYTESHDDRTWIDCITQNVANNGFYPTPLDRRRTHLMVAIQMMCLGTPLMASGQDFLRSKWGVNNTYQRGDINALDYERQREYSGTHDYFRSWIKFRLSDRAQILRPDRYPESGFFEFHHPDAGSGLLVIANANGKAGRWQLAFAVNPNAFPAHFKLSPELNQEGWIQLADHERFAFDGLSSALILLKSHMQLPPVSCALWIRRV